MKNLLILLLSSLTFSAIGQTKSDTVQKQADSVADKQEITVHPKKRRNVIKNVLQVETFEDNLVGYTWDSDDEPFLDFTLSEDFRLIPFDLLMQTLHTGKNLHLHFSFTCRLGQYINTRYSSPVVEKRFNPQLYLEYLPKGTLINSKIRFIYGHESNGQAIDDSSTFYAIAGTVKAPDVVRQTIDAISRGWDYLGCSFIKDRAMPTRKKTVLEGELDLRYYLDYGLLQGAKEEYRSWEQPWYGNNYTRNEVSGIKASISCFIPNSVFYKLSAYYETGITTPFENNSVKLLLGVKILQLPLAFVYTNGYNGDLAQYGKRNNSISATVLLSSFAAPIIRQ